MIKKPIGGERLGTGNKMEVELHNYQRSSHDVGYAWRSTMSAGPLVPFCKYIALPGSDFDLDLQGEVLTLPTNGPLFGSYKLQLDVFSVPMRLYNSYLHNNKMDIGLTMDKVKIPVIEMEVRNYNDIIFDEGLPDSLDNIQVNPSSLLAYMGIRGVGFPDLSGDPGPWYRSFNAIAILAYWDIYKQYYSNKQEGIGAVIHCPTLPAQSETITDINYTPPGTGSGKTSIVQAPGTSPNVTIAQGGELTIEFSGAAPDPALVFINLENSGQVSVLSLWGAFYNTTTDKISGVIASAMYAGEKIINWTYNSGIIPIQNEPQIETFPLTNIDEMREAILAHASTTDPFKINTPNLVPYKYLYEYGGDTPYVLCSQEGLGLKTYLSDKFNNWMKTEFIEAISDQSAVDVIDDKFTIDALIIGKKIYELLNRIAVSGGTYRDWIEAAYAENTLRQAETPMYMGGLSREVVFQEVISNAGTEFQPLGTLGGRGRMAQGQRGGKVRISVDEPSYIIGLASLTPRIDYSQGNEWDVNLQTFDDFHKPGLDQIGFQDLITEQMAWWDTYHNGTQWVQRSAGKQPAWIDYMTAVSKTYGNFAIRSNSMFMTLNRRYEHEVDGTIRIKDLTTYIDPTKFNHIFAENSLDAQNFWVQIGINATARRKMSAKIMPNL